jgi:hypothetical protein
MNSDNSLSEKKGFPGKIGWWILTGILVFTILYLYASFASPVKKIKQINGAFNDTITSDLLDKTYPEPDNPVIFNLYREKIFLESRLTMAKTNSIGLVVNLQDSILDIEIGGIILHSTKISKYRISRTFRGIDNKAFIGLFSKPLTTVSNSGTFVKEPIVVKKAPKDTIEAARQATVPDSIKTGPAYVALTLDYNIRLSLYQKNTGSVWALIYRFVFKSGRRFRQAGETIRGAAIFRVPDYRPEIRVYIPKDDLVTIYRALPVDTRVVIKL